MISVEDLEIGQKVVHGKHGIGTIVILDDTDNTILVDFENDRSWYGANDSDISYDVQTNSDEEHPTECIGMSESGVPLQPRSEHYQNMGIDVLTFCKANLKDFSGYEGALMLPITKYIWRHKENRLEDLLKARDFLDLLIANEEEHAKILENN